MLDRGAALHAPTQRIRLVLVQVLDVRLRRVNLLLRLGGGGVVLGHPGGRTPALAAEDDAEAFNGLLPVMRPSQLVPPGLLIAGDPFGSEGRDPESGDCSLRTSILFELREHLTDCPASREAEGCRARQEMRIARTAKLGAALSPPNFRARDATTMNADLVAAQLEEFRAALAEVNANVRLLPLSPRSSLPRASLADPLVAPENDSSTPRPRLLNAPRRRTTPSAPISRRRTRGPYATPRASWTRSGPPRAPRTSPGTRTSPVPWSRPRRRYRASRGRTRPRCWNGTRKSTRFANVSRVPDRDARATRVLRESRGVARERDAGFPGGRAGGQAGRGCALPGAHRRGTPRGARRAASRSARRSARSLSTSTARARRMASASAASRSARRCGTRGSASSAGSTGGRGSGMPEAGKAGERRRTRKSAETDDTGTDE